MRNNIYFFVFFFSVVLNLESAGQDSMPLLKSDSAAVYQKIESFSNQRKITRLVYPLFFRPYNRFAAPNTETTKTIPDKESYSNFEGKIIRKISVITLDPFGYNLRDTSSKPHDFLSHAADKMHVKTLPITIKNNLLIRRNDRFDSLLVKESERLIRQQRFVRDVTFNVVLIESDSVDIIIREQDVWSIIPDGSLSNTHLEMKLTEQNFLGTGHQFQNTYVWNYTTGKASYDAAYYIPNIDNTFINTSLLYTQAEDKSYIKRLDVERPFYSPFARWAGGALIEQQLRRDSLLIPHSVKILQNFKLNTHDYWMGSSWQIFKGRSEFQRTTNLILTARRLDIRYLEKPTELIDTLDIYSNETSYFVGLGINSRNYNQDKFIFRYGVTEDIPVGRTFEVIAGNRKKNDHNQIYAGAKIAQSYYYSWGYLSTNLEYGSFFCSGGAQQGIVKGELTYFTHLVELGNWRFRQFVKSQLLLGMDRLPTDKLSINNELGIRGFDSPDLTGTKKFLLIIQTQSYAPWNVFGFRFGPFMKYSLAMLGDDDSGFRKSRMYSQVGLGVLIKNDFLNSNYFQVSLAFYPTIPGTGDNILKSNSIKTSDIGFRDFEIGKPGVTDFQ